MKKAIVITCIILSFLRTFSQTPPVIENYTLKNGLKVYFLKYGKIDAITVSFVVNCGKKNEVPGQQAFNSIVSSMLLQGNSKYSIDDQNDRAFRLGAELESSADFDKTTISGNFLSKDSDAAIDLLSAAIKQPLFDNDKLQQFLSYIKDNNNPAKMNIGKMADVYSNLSIYGTENPLGRCAYKKQLEQVTKDKIKEFYLFNYTPKNTRIFICGNFNSDSLRNTIDKYLSDWQSTYGEVNGVALDLPTINKKEIYFVNRNSATQCALRWTKIAPAADHKDELAFTIANFLFQEQLFREVREKGGKTYGINSSHRISKFSNLLAVSCSVRNSEVYNTIALFDNTLQNFYNLNFTPEEFANEKTRFKMVVNMKEMPSEILDFYNPLEHDFKRRNDIMAELEKLKIEDVQKIIKKYFTPNVYKLVIAGDGNAVVKQLGLIPSLKKYSETDLEMIH